MDNTLDQKTKTPATLFDNAAGIASYKRASAHLQSAYDCLRSSPNVRVDHNDRLKSTLQALQTQLESAIAEECRHAKYPQVEGETFEKALKHARQIPDIEIHIWRDTRISVTNCDPGDHHLSHPTRDQSVALAILGFVCTDYTHGKYELYEYNPEFTTQYLKIVERAAWVAGAKVTGDLTSRKMVVHKPSDEWGQLTVGEFCSKTGLFPLTRSQTPERAFGLSYNDIPTAVTLSEGGVSQ